MRTSLRSITCLRKPAKLPGPALPVSIAVVTPEGRQNSSASMPREVPPQYPWVCRSISPGATVSPVTSRVSAALERSVPTLATLPPENATSVTRSMFCEGSMTLPPFRMRSNCIDPLQSPRAVHDQAIEEPATLVQLAHRDELVGLVRL